MPTRAAILGREVTQALASPSSIENKSTNDGLLCGLNYINIKMLAQSLAYNQHGVNSTHTNQAHGQWHLGALVGKQPARGSAELPHLDSLWREVGSCSSL